MQKLILLLIFVLFLPIATALYGGETWSYHFPYCDELRVNITGELPIDDGEYLILNNCTENSPNNYICNCTNDYYFNVLFKTNALNNYTFDFNYAYSQEVEEPTPTGGSQGTSSGTFTLRFTNKTRTLMLKQFTFSRFWVNDKQHTIRIIEIGEDWIKLEIKSEPMNITIQLNEPKEVQIDDQILKLNLKEVRGRVAFVEFTKIEKIIKEEPKVIERDVEDGISLTEKIETPEGNGIICTTCGGGGIKVEDNFIDLIIKLLIKIIVVLLVVILGLLSYFVYRNRKFHSKESKKEESL